MSISEESSCRKSDNSSYTDNNRVTYIIVNNDDNTVTKRQSFRTGCIEMAIYRKIRLEWLFTYCNVIESSESSEPSDSGELNRLSELNILKDKIILGVEGHSNILKPSSAAAWLEIDMETGNSKIGVNITTPKMNTVDREHVGARGISKWLSDMVAAITYLDSLHIYQNDIKLSNILYDASTDNYLLFDFDFATFGTDSLQYRWCSYQTMAPEVLQRNYRNQKNIIIDSKSEVYSLGMVLYHIITGVQPLYVDDNDIGTNYNFMIKSRKDRVWLEYIKTSKYYDLIEGMTRLDPQERIPLSDIIHNHHYYSHHQPQHIQDCGQNGNNQNSNNDKNEKQHKLSINSLYEMLNEASEYNMSEQMKDHIDLVSNFLLFDSNYISITVIDYRKLVNHVKLLINRYLVTKSCDDHFDQLMLIFNMLNLAANLYYQDDIYQIPYNWIQAYAEVCDLNYYNSDTPDALVQMFSCDLYPIPQSPLSPTTPLSPSSSSSYVMSGRGHHYSYQKVKHNMVDIANTLDFNFY